MDYKTAILCDVIGGGSLDWERVEDILTDIGNRGLEETFEENIVEALDIYGKGNVDPVAVLYDSILQYVSWEYRDYPIGEFITEHVSVYGNYLDTSYVLEGATINDWNVAVLKTYIQNDCIKHDRFIVFIAQSIGGIDGYDAKAVIEAFNYIDFHLLKELGKDESEDDEPIFDEYDIYELFEINDKTNDVVMHSDKHKIIKLLIDVLIEEIDTFENKFQELGLDKEKVLKALQEIKKRTKPVYTASP